MGLFSRIFGRGKKEPLPKGHMTKMARYGLHEKGGFTGGYGADRFRSIIEAHSSAEEIATHFEMQKQGNPYSPEAWDEAFAHFWETASAQYEEQQGFFLSLIEADEAEIAMLQREIDDLNGQISDLEDEIEQLINDLYGDPDEGEEIADEIEALENEKSMLQGEADALGDQVSFLEEEIDGFHDEMEMLSVEEFLADEGEIEELALENAVKVAEDYIDGTVWIPEDIINWAYYSVSDHNR